MSKDIAAIRAQHAKLTDRRVSLESFKATMVAAGGVSKLVASGLEQDIPGFISSKRSINGYTHHPSLSNYAVTLEDIDTAIVDTEQELAESLLMELEVQVDKVLTVVSDWGLRLTLPNTPPPPTYLLNGEYFENSTLPVADVQAYLSKCAKSITGESYDCTASTVAACVMDFANEIVRKQYAHCSDLASQIILNGGTVPGVEQLTAHLDGRAHNTGLSVRVIKDLLRGNRTCPFADKFGWSPDDRTDDQWAEALVVIQATQARDATSMTPVSPERFIQACPTFSLSKELATSITASMCVANDALTAIMDEEFVCVNPMPGQIERIQRAQSHLVFLDQIVTLLAVQNDFIYQFAVARASILEAIVTRIEQMPDHVQAPVVRGTVSVESRTLVFRV